MFKLAICDDDQIIGNYIEEIIMQYTQTKSLSIGIEVYQTTAELYATMKSGQWFDLIFLDILFEDENGVEIGKKIREDLDNQRVQIVYMSAKENCSIELFETRPMNFIQKPIDEDKIIESIEKCMYLAGWNDENFQYKKGHNIHTIPRENIIYFESIGRKIKMVTTRGEVDFYGKLEEIYEALKEYHFLDIHRSYIVNYSKIIEFKYDEVTVHGNIKLPISQPKRKKMRIMQMDLIHYKNTYK